MYIKLTWICQIELKQGIDICEAKKINTTCNPLNKIWTYMVYIAYTDPVTRHPKSYKREMQKKIENKFHNQANDPKHFTAHTREGVTLWTRLQNSCQT